MSGEMKWKRAPMDRGASLASRSRLRHLACPARPTAMQSIRTGMACSCSRDHPSELTGRVRTQVSSRRSARPVPPPSSRAPSPPRPRARPLRAPRSRRPSTKSRRARHSTSQRSTRTSSASRPRATASSMPSARWTRLSTGRGRVPCGRWCVSSLSFRRAGFQDGGDALTVGRSPMYPRLGRCSRSLCLCLVSMLA